MRPPRAKTSNRGRGRPKGATADKRAARLRDVEQLLVSGIEGAVLEAALVEKYKVSVDTVRKDVADVKEGWQRGGQSDEQRKLQAVYRKAMASDKVGAAIAAARQLSTSGDGLSAVQRFKALGTPPVDPMERNKWAQGVVAAMIEEVGTDEDMNKRDRHAYMLKYLRILPILTPYVELHEAEERIRKDREGLEEDEDAELEDVGDSPTRPLRG